MWEKLLQEGGLSLERLRTFCAVADAGGISRVAKGDPSKQSLYSRQIKELEEFFQIEITRRKGRGIELTNSGKELAKLAREQFQAFDDFKQNCSKGAVEYRMGAGNSIFEWLLIPKINVLQKVHPKVNISLSNLQTNQILQGLLDHTLDFGYLRKSQISSTHNLKTYGLGSFGYSLVIPRSWKLQRTSLEQIISEKPLAMVVGGELSQMFQHACDKAGIIYRVAFGCGDHIQASKLAEIGAAAAILPDIAIPSLKGLCDIRSMSFFTYKRELVLAWHPRLTSIRPGKTNAVIDSLKLIRV